MFRLLDGQGLLSIRNPTGVHPQFHRGEAMALALAEEEGWWLLINEQRPLTLARQRGIKAVTVPELIVYLYFTTNTFASYDVTRHGSAYGSAL